MGVCVCVVKRGATLAGAFLLNQQSEFEKFSERKFLADLGFGVCFLKEFEDFSLN